MICITNTYSSTVSAVLIRLKYCLYGLKHYSINQSINQLCQYRLITFRQDNPTCFVKDKKASSNVNLEKLFEFSLLFMEEPPMMFVLRITWDPWIVSPRPPRTMLSGPVTDIDVVVCSQTAVFLVSLALGSTNTWRCRSTVWTRP